MKRTAKIVVSCVLGALFFLASPAPALRAEEGDRFIFAAKSNNLWILNKEKRKVMYAIFEKPSYMWKTSAVTVPKEFDLDHSILLAVGNRGKFAFLCDKMTGKVTFFLVNGDGYIERYMDFEPPRSMK